MLTFTNYTGLSEYLSESQLNELTSDLEILNEGKKSNLLAKASSVALMTKIYSVSKKVKSEKKIEKKIDHLSDLMKYTAILSVLNIATTTGDKSIYKAGKRLK